MAGRKGNDMMEKNTATEIITDLTKKIILMDDQILSLYGEIQKVKAVFRAVHYAAAEGGITKTDADEALTGIGAMLDVLSDNAEEIMGYSNGLVKEVM